MTEKKIPKSVVITGIVCIALLEALALYKGIDGTIFTLVVGAIAGVIGWQIPHK